MKDQRAKHSNSKQYIPFRKDCLRTPNSTTAKAHSMRRPKVLLVILSFGFLCSCTSPSDKWLVYKSLQTGSPEFGYEAYKSFEDGKENQTVEIKRNNVVAAYEKFSRETDDEKKNQFLRLGKPTITERDDAHILAFFPVADTRKVVCEVSEKPLARPPARVFGTAEDLSTKRPPGPALAKPFVCDLHAKLKGGSVLIYRITDVTPKNKEEENKKDPKKPTQGGIGGGGRGSGSSGIAAAAISEKTTGTAAPTTEQRGKTTETPTPGSKEGKILLEDSTEIHALYRFRIMLGPAYTTLTNKRKSFSAQPNSLGQSIVTSSSKSESVVDLPLLLKIHWTPDGRDILEPLPPCNADAPLTCLYNVLQRFNPIIGFNLINKPFQNLYTGLSLELYQGLDIVGGLHWSKVQTLANGFQEGQVVPAGTSPATKEKFLQGWFVGLSVDTGVAASWLGKSTMGLFK